MSRNAALGTGVGRLMVRGGSVLVVGAMLLFGVGGTASAGSISGGHGSSNGIVLSDGLSSSWLRVDSGIGSSVRVGEQSLRFRAASQVLGVLHPSRRLNQALGELGNIQLGSAVVNVRTNDTPDNGPGSPIPEPMAFAAFGLGLLIVVGAKRRL